MFNKAAIAFLLSAASTATTSIVANAAIADFSDVTSEPIIEDLHDPEAFDTAHIVGIEQTLIVSYEHEEDLPGIEEVAKRHSGSRMKGAQKYSKPRRARGAAGKGKGGSGGRTASSGGGGRGRNGGGGRGRGRGKDGRFLEEEGDDVATIGFAVIETLASDTDIEIDELSNLPGVASIERAHEVTIDDMNLRGGGGGLGPSRHIREIMESINMGQVSVFYYMLHFYTIWVFIDECSTLFNPTLFSFLLFRINYCTVSKTLKMSSREIFMRGMSWKLIIVTLPHTRMTIQD